MSKGCIGSNFVLFARQFIFNITFQPSVEDKGQHALFCNFFLLKLGHVVRYRKAGMLVKCQEWIQASGSLPRLKRKGAITSAGSSQLQQSPGLKAIWSICGPQLIPGWCLSAE